jgi:hypothetical protein
MSMIGSGHYRNRSHENVVILNFGVAAPVPGAYHRSIFYGAVEKPESM